MTDYEAEWNDVWNDAVQESVYLIQGGVDFETAIESVWGPHEGTEATAYWNFRNAVKELLN